MTWGGHTFHARALAPPTPFAGRLVMWGWCQETGRPQGSFDYGSCLSVPRLLWHHPEAKGFLWQVRALMLPFTYLEAKGQSMLLSDP